MRTRCTRANAVKNNPATRTERLFIAEPRFQAPAVAAGRYRGATAYGFPPSAWDISAIECWARTLLPAASSGGEITAMPNFPGETAMRPPPTPLFPGKIG